LKIENFKLKIMYILGISCYYHDAAACLIKDGLIVAAAEEERFSRKKHDSSFPKKAIDFCLQTANISKKEIDYAVFYEKPFRKFHRILISTLSTYPKSYASFREAIRIWLIQKLWVKQDITSYLDLDSSRILFSEHHLSHAASCFFPSPFKEAAILTVDGVGEWTTASYGIGENNKIKIVKEIRFPQSLGLLYSAFTAFLGFEVNEGEWKVMGLAPYGKPKYTDKIWKTVRKLSDGSFSLDFSYFSFHYSDKYSFSGKLIDLFGDPIAPEQSHLVTEKAADIAASIQKVTEELLISMAKYLKKETGLSNLCLSGGVALNSVANYKILEESGFANIYLQPACGDSGGALGAALYVYYHVLNKSAVKTPGGGISNNRYILNTAYLGQQWSDESIEQFLKNNVILACPESGGDPGCSAGWRITRMTGEKLIDYVSDQLIKGKVVGWMQGRFEWGPRALGARSILADARNPKMKDIINSKVKFREAFRPFAPSVLAEFADKVFDLSTTHNSQLTTHYPLRFMLYVVPVKKQWRKKVPAITHADHTARPQLIFKEENPLYHKLVTAFHKKTGVPLLLNTSFNLKGEPIVASPADAYSTFQRSGIDILVMGNFVCEKDI
jgi:carbamoyltransferase